MVDIERATGPAVVIHVPHASTAVPDDVRPQLLLDDRELAEELLRMTDAHTDELFAGSVEGAEVIAFPVSRLVLDPERFEDDDLETMAARGMGVIYERTSDGRQLRHPPRPDERAQLLERFYRPHHAELTRLVEQGLRRQGRCLVIDGHSFPGLPLPYEHDDDVDRPDICIGTDSFHTPDAVRDAGISAARALQWSVAVDHPFSGSMVPSTHYGQDRRVLSVMVEVNRRLYMDEATGERLPEFPAVKERVRILLERIVAAADT